MNRNFVAKGIFLSIMIMTAASFVPIGNSTITQKIPQPRITSTTWIVDKNGHGNFTEIQEAIDNEDVKDGDTLFVYNPNPTSTHYEGNITVYKELIIIGFEISLEDNKTYGKPTINASFQPNTNVITIDTDNVVLSGLNITGSGKEFYWTGPGVPGRWQKKGYRYQGIFIDRDVGSITISYNNIYQNGQGIRISKSKAKSAGFSIHNNSINDNFDNGIVFTTLSSGVLLENNMIINNGFSEIVNGSEVNQGDGIEFHTETYASQIKNNIISGNFVDGIWLEDSVGHTFTENIITDNKRNTGIHMKNCIGITISYNLISGHDYFEFSPGFFYSPCAGIDIQGGNNNYIHHNNISYNTYGIHLNSTGTVKVMNNSINNNSVGMWTASASGTLVQYNDIMDNDRICSLVLLYCMNNNYNDNNIKASNRLLLFAWESQANFQWNWWGGFTGPFLRTIRLIIPPLVPVIPFRFFELPNNTSDI